MKALSRDQRKEHERILTTLKSQMETCATQLALVNTEIENLNTLIAAYNETIVEASDFAQSITDAMQDYASDRSDQWQEGEAGQRYDEWYQRWDNLGLSDMDTVDALDDLDDYNAVEDFASLPMSLDDL